jgi:hypothetical protein
MRAKIYKADFAPFSRISKYFTQIQHRQKCESMKPGMVHSIEQSRAFFLNSVQISYPIMWIFSVYAEIVDIVQSKMTLNKASMSLSHWSIIEAKNLVKHHLTPKNSRSSIV